ncbi:MAG: hypothetical protein NXH70_02535 [Hyphomonas sp.]|nr:hypothetical protein [Hyphomonas sp.]
MSDDGIHEIKTDVALIKQEVHHLRESVKSIHAIFRWGLVVIVTSIATALMNIVLGGDFTK